MKSVDTNILARYVTQDDPTQASIAVEVLSAECFVSDTVLLETAWLLTSYYKINRADLAAILDNVRRLPSVTVSNDEHIEWAIRRFAAGADFADMIHIVASSHARSMVSFDLKLAEQAGPDSPLLIETVSGRPT